MKQNCAGKQSLIFARPPRIISGAAVVGDVEGVGPLGGDFDMILMDDTWGEETWEKAERKMFEDAIKRAVAKADLKNSDIDCLLGGDLLNQIVTANFAARELMMPFIGLYGACSTMAQSLMLAGIMIDGGFANLVACASSSHFSTAERQYRNPLEMGGQTAPVAQRTVTGAGCSLVADAGYAGQAELLHIYIAGATIGKVVDFGITDTSNMGAAMAPAAADTLITHLNDTGKQITDYDVVVTGDLGSFGSDMLRELCRERGVNINGRHADCGVLIYDAKKQNVDCGGSGCGCSAAVMNGHLLKKMDAGGYDRMLFIATGALMSPTTGLQGDTIPGIAHAVSLERR